MVSLSVTVVYVDTSYLRILGSRYQLIVAPIIKGHVRFGGTGSGGGSSSE